MPKQEKYPELGEDANFFTVVQPYPQNGNMELLTDRKETAYWLASVLGNWEHLFAIYNMPSSPSSIIIGVSKEFKDIRRLLGAHRWDDFLTNPGSADFDRVTKIFFCTYTTEREVTKKGWKTKHIDESLFQGWIPANKEIVHPYPLSRYCEPPPENDPIQVKLCRPLPAEIFPEAAVKVPVTPVARPPVVGTPEYFASKAAGAAGAGKGRQTKSADAKSTAGSTKSAAGAPPTWSQVPKAANVRSAASAPAAFVSGKPQTPLGPPPGLATPAWVRGAPSARGSVPMSPPGLGKAPSVSGSSTTGSGDAASVADSAASAPTSYYSSPPGSVLAGEDMEAKLNAMSLGGDDEYLDEDGNPLFDDDEPVGVPRSAYTQFTTEPSAGSGPKAKAKAQAASSAGAGKKGKNGPANGQGVRYKAGSVKFEGAWADDGDGFGRGGSVGAPASEADTQWQSEAETEGAWPEDAPPLGDDGWPTDTPDATPGKEGEGEIEMCPEHGQLCSRGICKWRAARKGEQERKKRWEEKEKQREEQREKARKKSRRGPPVEEARREDRVRDEPPHKERSLSDDEEDDDDDDPSMADDASTVSGGTALPSSRPWGGSAPAARQTKAGTTVWGKAASLGSDSGSVRSGQTSAWGKASNSGAGSGTSMYLNNGQPADGGWGGTPTRSPMQQQPQHQQGGSRGGSSRGSAWGNSQRGGQSSRGGSSRGGGSAWGRGNSTRGSAPSERSSRNTWDTSSVKAWSDR